MTVKGIEALEAIRDNMSIFIEELKGMTSQSDVPAEETTVPAVEEETAIAPKSTRKTSRKAKEESETIPSADELTEEKLNALSYNNLKKLAKDMGIAATGARDELTQKILAHQNEASTEEEPETPAVKETKTSSKKTTRKVKKQEEPEPDDEEDEDPIVAQVNEAVADMTNEEIANLLTEVGVRAKGKRQALISAVIKAVHDGKIDLDGDDEDETDEPESEDEEFDVNDPENPDMTEERRTALEAYKSEVETDFDEGTITRPQIVEWLNEFYGTKDTMKKKSDDELVAEYIHCSSLFINDEGDMIEEEGAYTVNGVPYCCGHQLSYSEDDGVYICENCGAEYEAEEE